MNLKIGDPIPANLQLFDSDATKYVRATVRNSAGGVLGIVSLTHVASGLYAGAGANAPADSKFVTIQYRIYNDAGFTIESALHGAGLDVFAIESVPFSLADVVAAVWNEPMSSHAIAGSLGRQLSETVTPASFIPADQEIEVDFGDVQLIEIEIED